MLTPIYLSLFAGDFFNQGEVEMKKSSTFKLEKILFFLSGQVVQLSRYTFFRFVDLNGLGVGWGRGTNHKRQFFLPKIKIGSFNSKFSETSKYQILKKYIFLTKVAKKF